MTSFWNIAFGTTSLLLSQVLRTEWKSLMSSTKQNSFLNITASPILKGLVTAIISPEIRFERVD